MLLQVDPDDIFINRIGILITWVTFVVFLFKNSQDKKANDRNIEKHRRELEESNERLIKRVCREFIQGQEYTDNREKRIREVSRYEIDEAFRQRAESFVDAKEYRADRRHIDDSLQRLEKSIAENSKLVAELTGKLTQMVLIDNSLKDDLMDKTDRWKKK